MRDLLLSVDRPDLVNGVVNGGTQASMHTEDAIVHDGSERQIVEYVCAVAPNIEGAILSQAFVIETINLSNLPAFVISADQSDKVGIAYLKSEQKEESFHTVEAPIYEVSEKQIANLGDVPTIPKQLQQIIELAMDVPANGDGRVDALHVALLDENFSRLGTQLLDLLLGDIFALPQLLDLLVDLTHQINQFQPEPPSQQFFHPFSLSSSTSPLFIPLRSMLGTFIKSKEGIFSTVKLYKQQMSHIKELIQKLAAEGGEGASEELLKKLIYLAVNESGNFRGYALRIAQIMKNRMQLIEDDQKKILVLQLLSQIASNFTEAIPFHYYNFNHMVKQLSDDNIEVRKASHYLFIIFIKKYAQLDLILFEYLRHLKEQSEHWKTIQKIIHSFQGLLVVEPRCIIFIRDFQVLNDMLELIHTHGFHHENLLVQKAADQTLSTFIRNDHISEVLPKLSAKLVNCLVDYASTANIHLHVKQRQTELLIQELPPDVYQTRQKGPQNARITSPKRTEIPKSLSIQRKEVRTSQSKKTLCEAAKPSPKKPEVRLVNELEMLLSQMQKQTDWKVKSDLIDEIARKVQNESDLQIPKEMVEVMLELSYDNNFKICITSLNIVYTLFVKYERSLESKIKRIEEVTIDKICDIKMAVRQVASKIMRKLFTLNANETVRKLLSKLSNCPVVGKEEILSFLQESYATSPPSDLGFVLGEVSLQISNENTRLKIKTLDCLVKISLVSNIEECKFILQKKLNKVYYDMFLERLKEKTTESRWEDKSLNHGMTWQAERNPVEANDKFNTKIEFGRKNPKPQEESAYDFSYQPPAELKEETRQFKSPIDSSMTRPGQNTRNSENNESRQTFGVTSNSSLSSKVYETIKSEEPANRLSKRVAEFTRPSTLVNYEMEEEEKKIPLKPNPVKKRSINNQNKEEEGTLVIQSREYRNRNGLDEIKEERPIKSVRPPRPPVDEEDRIAMKPSRPSKEVRMSKEDNLESEFNREDREQEPKSVVSTSVKRSGKKQHQINYKATQYAAREELEPVTNPKEMLREVALNLPKDAEWSKQFESLDGLRRLLRHHEDIYPLIYERLPLIMPEVLKLVDSLRSTLAKNGMITLSEMCECLKKAMDPFLEAIFTKLFKKAQDANTFIVEEVKKCMGSLCCYCSSQKIVAVIVNNAQAKAAPIKTKVAHCINSLLAKEDYSLHVFTEQPKVLAVLNSLILDNAAEVRALAKEVFMCLIEFNSKNDLEAVFRKSSKESWERWKVILDRESK